MKMKTKIIKALPRLDPSREPLHREFNNKSKDKLPLSTGRRVLLETKELSWEVVSELLKWDIPLRIGNKTPRSCGPQPASHLSRQMTRITSLPTKWLFWRELRLQCPIIMGRQTPKNSMEEIITITIITTTITTIINRKRFKIRKLSGTKTFYVQ